ncbi:MAG TPA: carboxypeptidase-like regulatory domain-containing protein [Thermoanaerobaculia bacterium]|nr:carboxypeptidase-like regulatory domain-containing protein [Thermoanaerobaculia bacterium]
MPGRRQFRIPILITLTLLIATVSFAQQTGSVSGSVTSSDGAGLPGVTVEARSSQLPQARVTTTQANGDYRLPALPPGEVTLSFTLAGMQEQTRNVRVNLGQDSTVNVELAVAGLAETITVTADSPLLDPTTTAIRSSVAQEAIERLPIGQEYRDLVKLAPAIQYTEDQVRGPSSGGSGQDNVYQFDGVNVTLPLFGTLAAEPSAHDIQQISFVKGGAKATDFNRAGGFTIDSVSKSGTSEWSGELKYQVQTDSMTADQDFVVTNRFDEDRDWATFGIGGPVVRDRLFFYGSYYRPTRDRANTSNAYGPVADFDSVRDEMFGKLTFTPTGNMLLHGSYRDSSRTDENASVGAFEAATASLGEESDQTIAIFEGSWIITDRSFATVKWTDFGYETASRPDLLLSVTPSLAAGTRLDIGNLDQMGYFSVPSPVSGQDAFNAFIDPLIQRYGFVRDGVRVGGGAVGGGFQTNDQDFFRQSGQVGYDFTVGDVVSHDIHVGYQWYTDEEDLARFRNGWGLITVPGGRSTCGENTGCEDQPIFFQAEFQRSTEAAVGHQVIHSEFKSSNFEVNDTIRWGNWAFNAGVLVSNDILYGQGLREDSSTLSGYVSAPGNKYKMYEVDFEDQIQPRLGATWAYNGLDTLYASYSRYNPAASSLPRAASWDRNTTGLVTRAYFDADGNLIGSQQLAGSSGKLFQEGLEPRYTDEYLIGTAKQFNNRLSGRLYARHRYSANFWEDTNNTARVAFEPPAGIPRTPYIPDLGDRVSQIGSGSSYVIAQLDGAFTKYYEVSAETDWQATDQLFLRGSYTWSHYYGNMDQDNTTVNNDQSIFIGSSNIADAAGRQIWDNKYGDLRSDRPHLLKVYGYYSLPWNATAGAYGVFQSGHAWEAWAHQPYSHLTGSTSDTNRYAEPAGSRRTDSHYQVDVSYTQNIPLAGVNLQLIADIFNLTDNQTGYNPQPSLNSSQFGVSRSHYAPQRFQLAVRLQF